MRTEGPDPWGEAPALAVRCEPRDDGWHCEVSIGDDPGRSHHEVAVAAGDLARLAPAATSVERLVEASFAFLLEREPRESILRRFDLSVIARYFPEYEREIRQRLAS